MAKIKLISICELIEQENVSPKYKFFIPSYQRGYKWRETDVEHLIEDICEIDENDLSDYCLQPVVVTRKDKMSNEYILVDGQQRLTTIWLILNTAKYPLYEIEYESRDKSNNYLQKLNKGSDVVNPTIYETCDTYYFNQAITAINRHTSEVGKFINNLKKNVKIIWYELDNPEDGPAHFERLNNAKISLTNAELVKAYIMTNTDSTSIERMACEWDEMEYKLQNDEFFLFLVKADSDYFKEYNRIELLLDLYCGTKRSDREKDEQHTFNEIVRKHKKESIREIWNSIQAVFNRMMCWYNDKYLYNLIGYLIENKSINELHEIWRLNREHKALAGFKEEIRKRVIETIPPDDEIRRMEYKDGRTKNVLLLFNILCSLSVDKNKEYAFNDKFHFDLYKKEDWDKEHIHATASESLKSKVEKILWMKGLEIDSQMLEEKIDKEKIDKEKLEKYMCYVREAKDTDDNLKNVSATLSNLKDEEFKEMYNDIITLIEGDLSGHDNVDQNSIGNIVLLNANINRSAAYRVSPFSTKRRIIMDRVKSGSFVPLGTQNVFMKVYTPMPGHFYKWEKDYAYDGNEKSDRENYIDAIINTLNRLK
ncbi:MAG: DUF262 domain-containing protein [Bacteroidales bacterium]|nr:DUF262 domain-containing protein [Bacteroidales bacterium]